MYSYEQKGRGRELISFCKEKFNGREIALMYENGKADGHVFIRAESPEVITALKQRFPIERGAPGFKEFYFWKWMKIGRGEWFENSITLHFSNAS